MKTQHPEFDLLLSSISPSEGESARDLLAGKGIASKLERRVVETAELGASVLHVPRPDLLVPKGSRAAARAILVAAWGEARVAKFEPSAM